MPAKDASPPVEIDNNALVAPTVPPKTVAPAPVVVAKEYGVVEMLSMAPLKVIAAPLV